MPNIDPSLTPIKQDAKELITRICINAEERTLVIAKKLFKIIDSATSSLIINRIKSELADILMHIDMGIFSNPDDYFQAIIRANSSNTRP